MVAKLKLMLSQLGGKQKKSELNGFKFKRDSDLPARNFLPEGENSIPSDFQYQNNRLKLLEKQKLVDLVDI
jgi:hypothetical protein